MIADQHPAKRVAAAKKILPKLKRKAPLSEPIGPPLPEIDPGAFRTQLMDWYDKHARVLPWRGVSDPYATWLSEIMLQQTRVASVQARYVEFMRRWPTLALLAAATETEVLAIWSGLGYYRRARMLHRAAQFVARELGGVLPSTSTELKTLPGIGEYTSAAIASIAFGESIAVVDGNVERVLLRVLGRPQEKTFEAHSRVLKLAQKLVPPANPSGESDRKPPRNAPGDHNQAMMELGATLCLPRAPLCLQCPIFDHCRTRGEHITLQRSILKERRVAHLFALRQVRKRTEVLLEQRTPNSALMPGMFELPPIPLDSVTGRPPVLRARHGITDTVYKVEIFADDTTDGRSSLRDAIPASAEDLHWVPATQLSVVPLTGLARKCLVRLGVFTP